MKLSLVVLSEGKANGQRIPVTLSQFVIGRDAQCNLKPASPMISKRHCALIIKDGQVWLRDFNSTNGTFVNDEPVKGQRRLQNDDILKVGPLQFRLAIDTPTPVNKPTPIPPKANKGGEEDVADMLLSLGDDVAAEAALESDSDQEMSGSTVMDMPAFNPEPPPPEAKAPEEPKKPEPKKEEKKPSAQQSTAAAAKAILEKYTRRQR